MGKDPGFIFYPGDYLRDTQTLSEKVQVAYDRIMCEHMRNICISQSQLKFFTKRLSPDELEELMFVLIKVNGGFQIEWVAESITKRKAYSESRRKNREGKTKEDMSNTSRTYVPHMDNENENEIDNEVKKENKKRGKTLFKNSGVTKQDIIDAFQKADDLKIADADYYYNCLEDSSSKNYMYVDWIATARSWARKDLKEGKIKKKGRKAGTLDNHDRIGKPMTQADIRKYYAEHGKYPNQ